jgi:hypothetical protein
MLTVGFGGDYGVASLVELEAFRYALNRAGSVPEGVVDHLPIWQRQFRKVCVLVPSRVLAFCWQC